MHLIRVEQLLPAELDEASTSFIRQELFDDWLRLKLARALTDFSMLEQSG